MSRLLVGLLLLGACRGPAPTLVVAEQAAAGAAAEAADAPKPPKAPDVAPAQGGAGAEVSGVDGNGGSAEVLPTEPGGCGSEPVSLVELHSGQVRGGAAVAVTALVATSQKFLVSEAKTGSCLWGAFAADPQLTGAGSGVFLVSYGAKHAEGEACASGSDGLPDDLSPGDGLDVEGRVDEFVPAGCDAGTAPSLQLRIDVACPARPRPKQAPPEPSQLDAALATRLASGKDAALLRAWSGALVQLEAVSALQDADDGDAVFPFGVIRLQETALEVHSRLYYFDLSEGGPRDSGKAPHYGFPTAFQKVTGIVFLDYCTWVLAPRDRCADLTPSSDGCAAQAPGP